MNKLKCCLVVIVCFAILPAAAQFDTRNETPANSSAAPDAVSGVQKEAIEKIIHEYLLKNPVVIRDAMRALQEREEKERNRRLAETIKNFNSEIYFDSDSPVLGNGKADLAVVVFFDYFCGYCKTTLPELETLLANDKSIQVIYKEFPIMSPQSLVASKAALAAGRQGKYAEFHKALVETKRAGEDVIKEISVRLGLNYVTLQRDMNDPKIGEAIGRNIRLAASLDIDGTPAYLIGGRIIPGAIDSDHLAALIKEERARLLSDREKNKTERDPGK